MQSLQFQYCPEFLSRVDADSYLQQLLQGAHCWQQEVFSIFGRSVPAPRRLVWFGDQGVNYRYTGLDHVACGWPAWLRPLRHSIERQTNRSFNFVLANRYDCGSHHMGWHRDDERAAAPVIASVSLGAARAFLYRPTDAADSSRVILEHGSMCVFDGRIRHRLPPSKTVSDVRINLTFRHIET